MELEPIFGAKRCSIRIAKTEVLEFTPKQGDIDAGRIRPEALTKYLDFLTEFLGGDAVNFELNRKVVTVSYGNILAVLKGSVLKEVAYHI